MTTVSVRFHGELNDLVRSDLSQLGIVRTVPGSPAVKDVIESLGVPHVEVDAIVVDGVPVGFDHRVRDGESIDVFPVTLDEARPASSAPTGASASGDLRFVLDGHLGRLTAYLRMLGFDCTYSNHAEDRVLAALASSEDRILLTRDRGLLKRSIVRRGYLVRSDRSEDQLREVARRFDLGPHSRPFGRCLRCNELLQPIELSTARARVPPRVAAEQQEFRHCPACDALYWRGSHHARMLRLIATITDSRPAEQHPQRDGRPDGDNRHAEGRR